MQPLTLMTDEELFASWPADHYLIIATTRKTFSDMKLEYWLLDKDTYEALSTGDDAPSCSNFEARVALSSGIVKYSTMTPELRVVTIDDSKTPRKGFAQALIGLARYAMLNNMFMHLQTAEGIMREQDIESLEEVPVGKLGPRAIARAQHPWIQPRSVRKV